VSVLPPRPIAVPWQQAAEQARKLSSEFAPFEIEVGEVALFGVTQVIYLEVKRGADELRRMHDAMVRGLLAFDEPYPYHPHVTLAQELDPGTVEAAYRVAVERWREYRGPRSFRVDKTVFVQNTLCNGWLDLAELSLGTVPVG
jgi:2'-5' RNA ligase